MDGARCIEGEMDLLQEWCISGVQGASHHGFLPHQDPHLITQVVELLRGVEAPTPHPDHVHVGCHS